MDAQRIRIIHAADLHLESSFASLGVGSETGNRLREAQRTVLRRILDVARQWPADAVCIAGDLFDSIYVGEAVLREVMEILEHAAPLPVYITPGNRDPYVQDSPYALTLWPENVTVFPPGAWHAVPHEELPLTVHGFGYDGANDPQTPFGKLQISRDGRIHVAVAHGTEQGHKPPAGEVFAPFKITDVARDELAYLAMGHFHDITEVRGEFRTVACYPGTPQGRTFNETGPRHVLKVEIAREEREAPCVSVTPLDVSEILFERFELDINKASDAEGMFKAVCDRDTRKRVVRICLQGMRPARARAIITDLQVLACDFFLHADTDDRTVIGTETLLQARDNTCLSKLIDVMGARIIDETIRENALRECEALELILSAGHIVEPGILKEGCLLP